MARFDELIAAGDPAALLVEIDRLVYLRDWDGLTALAQACERAVEIGRQLWPVKMHIDYRLALEAPADYAAAVCVPGAAKFALGPLTEVVAARHTWNELAPHLRHPASRMTVMQERALRGEDLRGTGSPHEPHEPHEPQEPTPHELPLIKAPFEHACVLPEYQDRQASFGAPEVTLRSIPVGGVIDRGTFVPREPDDGCRALQQVVSVWADQSRGSVRTSHGEGSATAAVAELAPDAAIEGISAHDAIALLQWGGANGGAYGRRPGGAAGRFSTWWAVAMIAGLEWPDDADGDFADELQDVLRDLRWYRWTTPESRPGWELRVAVEDDGLTWALDATDALDPTDH